MKGMSSAVFSARISAGCRDEGRGFEAAASVGRPRGPLPFSASKTLAMSTPFFPRPRLSRGPLAHVLAFSRLRQHPVGGGRFRQRQYRRRLHLFPFGVAVGLLDERRETRRLLGFQAEPGEG